MNWYAKRAALAAVYGSTELFMLTDASAEFGATWGFLDDRLAQSAEAGRAVRAVTDAAALLFGTPPARA